VRFNESFRGKLMDTLHIVLPSIRGETKSRKNHVLAFREFLDHLDRISRTRGKSAPKPRGKPAGTARSGRGNGKS
jgi:hypothetical protein